MKTEPDEMASEYRFDYTKAKPNRFAEKMKLAGWTVEEFVTEEKISSPKGKTSKPVAKKKKK